MVDRRIIALVAVVGAASLAALTLFPSDGAAPDRAVNGITVRMLENGQVTVQPMAGRGPVDYWCAAGESLRVAEPDASAFHLAAPRDAASGPTFATGDGGETGETLDLETVGLTHSLAAVIGFCEASQRRIDGS